MIEDSGFWLDVAVRLWVTVPPTVAVILWYEVGVEKAKLAQHQSLLRKESLRADLLQERADLLQEQAMTWEAAKVQAESDALVATMKLGALVVSIQQEDADAGYNLRRNAAWQRIVKLCRDIDGEVDEEIDRFGC